MFYILLSGVIILSQMCPTMFKPEKFTQSYSEFHLVACDYNFQERLGENDKTICEHLYLGHIGWFSFNQELWLFIT